MLAEATAFAAGPERTEFVNAVVLLTGGVFLLFGLTGLGKAFLRLVPQVLRAAIILGAGLSAIYGEFIPRSGGRPARVDALTVSILVAVGLSLLLMFSKPLEPWKARYPWLRRLAAMGIAPGFIIGAIVGWAVGEIHFDEFAAYSGSVFFWPDFTGLVQNYSVIGLGLPSLSHFVHAIPLALIAYLIGFTDIITGTAILQEAAVDRRGDARKGVHPGRMRQGLDLPGHRFENRPQEFRIEHVPGRFAHRPQRGPRDSQGALHVLQSCGLLQRAQTGKDRVEEMQ